MRVLFVEHKTIFGGGQVALLNLLTQWQNSRMPIEPRVICSPQAKLVPRVRALNIACEAIELGAIEKTRGGAWNLAQRVAPTARLLQTIQRTRPYALVANGAYSFLASMFAAKLARIPILWWEHNTTLPNDAWLKRMITAADRIVVVSASIEQQFAELVPHARKKISVIHNGIDAQKFIPMRDARLVKRRELGWDDGVCVVGTVSRLSPEKGIEYFVDAAHEILRHSPDVRFLIVGDGPLRQELEQRAQSNAIRFVDAQEKVAAWLNAMDVFVIPSLAEGLPLAALEAMACELPVVASDVGGLREVVVQNETGLRVAPREADQIVRAVLELLRDRTRRCAFGKAGRARVENYFRLEQQARSMFEAIDSAPL